MKMKKAVLTLATLAISLSGLSVLASDHQVNENTSPKSEAKLAKLHQKERHIMKMKGAKKVDTTSAEGQHPATSSP